MNSKWTEKDIEDGRRISALFLSLSNNGRIRASTYLSALRDKELDEIREAAEQSEAREPEEVRK